jgi:hypothetical protein
VKETKDLRLPLRRVVARNFRIAAIRLEPRQSAKWCDKPT